MASELSISTEDNDSELWASRTIGSERQLWSISRNLEGQPHKFLLRPSKSRAFSGLALALALDALNSPTRASDVARFDGKCSKAEFDNVCGIPGQPAIITGCQDAAKWPAGEGFWYAEITFPFLPALTFCC